MSCGHYQLVLRSVSFMKDMVIELSSELTVCGIVITSAYWIRAYSARLQHGIRRLQSFGPCGRQAVGRLKLFWLRLCQVASIIAVITLICRVNPPTAMADLVGDRTINLTHFSDKPNAPHQIELPFDPLGSWAMWARCSLKHESINLKFTASEPNRPGVQLNSSFGLEFPILDSGATSSGTNKIDALSNTYSDHTVVGGALGKYAVCTTRGDLSFTAYDRNTKKFAHVTMANTCYIPDLQQDLFSVGKLQREGLFFSNESLTLHTRTSGNGQRRSELPFTLSHGLYRLPVMYSTPSAIMSTEHQTLNSVETVRR